MALGTAEFAAHIGKSDAFVAFGSLSITTLGAAELAVAVVNQLHLVYADPLGRIKEYHEGPHHRRYRLYRQSCSG